jgi:hypothetical protein
VDCSRRFASKHAALEAWRLGDQRARRPNRWLRLVLIVGIGLGGTIARVVVASAITTAYNREGVQLWDGVPTFPIGLSTPPWITQQTPSGGNALDQVVGAGVDLLRFNPASNSWSDADITHAEQLDAAAKARDVATWMFLGDLGHAQSGTAAGERLQQVVSALASSDGMGIWKGADEPFRAGLSAASLAYAYRETRTLDPNHLFSIIEAPEGTVSQLRPYSTVTNVHGVDEYPIHYGATDPDLHLVGTWTHTIALATPDLAVTTTLEICFSKSGGPAGKFVLPTRVQERYMIYDAIINGARGLVFYGGSSPTCFQPSDQSLGWNWSFWYGVLQSLITEIGPHSPVYPALLVPGTGLGLHTSDVTIQVLSRVVASKNIWVFAASHAAGTRSVTISGLPSTATQAVRYPGPGSIALHNGSFQDVFARWGVRVYHVN